MIGLMRLIVKKVAPAIALAGSGIYLAGLAAHATVGRRATPRG